MVCHPTRCIQESKINWRFGITPSLHSVDTLPFAAQYQFVNTFQKSMFLMTSEYQLKEAKI
jgi:hypothetical protein